MMLFCTVLDQSVANAGATLFHVFNNEFNTEFDRPNARNLILSFSDGNPQDDEATIGKLLRDNGVIVSSSGYGIGYGLSWLRYSQFRIGSVNTIHKIGL